MIKVSKFCRIVLSVVLILVLTAPSHSAMLKSPRESREENSRRRSYTPSLPREGTVAVLADSNDPQHAAIAETMIIDELVSNGYRVVDDATLGKIHRAAERTQAFNHAFGGSVTGISNIGRSYKTAYTILARVKAGRPERNEAGLYTGTASVTMMAVSSKGTKLGGKVSNGKAVGYTMDEAREKALTSALQSGLAQLF